MLKDVVMKYTEDWAPNHPHVYNCAEVMLRSINEYYDLGLEGDSLKLAAGFGGGICVESTCGIMTGSVMALSAKYANSEPPHKSQELTDKVKGLAFRMEEEFGSCDCRDIKTDGCVDLILRAAEFIEEIW
ncbi:MAG: C-GCAxxG-C-C family protein [Tissierellia bacterium]|nr:C-GCAxxG-C-C family protein [Tissierellia bacterium]